MLGTVRLAALTQEASIRTNLFILVLLFQSVLKAVMPKSVGLRYTFISGHFNVLAILSLEVTSYSGCAFTDVGQAIFTSSLFLLHDR